MKRKTILKQLGNEYLQLYQAPGYFYFVYDDGTAYHTHSVMVDKLSHMDIEQWVDEGKIFLRELELEYGIK